MAQSIRLNNDIYWDETAIHNMPFMLQKSINGGSSGTITLPNGFRGFMITIGITVASNANGMYILACQSNGAAHSIPISSASNLSMTDGTNQVTITNNASQSVYGPCTVFVIGSLRAS